MIVRDSRGDGREGTGGGVGKGAVGKGAVDVAASAVPAERLDADAERTDLDSRWAQLKACEAALEKRLIAAAQSASASSSSQPRKRLWSGAPAPNVSQPLGGASCRRLRRHGCRCSR